MTVVQPIWSGSPETVDHVAIFALLTVKNQRLLGRRSPELAWEDDMSGKVKVMLPDGRVVDAVEVGIDETVERWTEVKLADGTIMKVKLAVISAARTDQYDTQGNPIYNFNFSPVVVVGEVPASLKRKGS